MDQTENIMTMRRYMTDLFWKIVEEKEKLVMDGVPAYNEKAQFVPGKVINFSCYVALELLKDTGQYQTGMVSLKEVIRGMSGMPMETWGILNGITGLRRLQLAGRLEEIVDEDTMETLKKSLDWRTFVDVEDHYALIGKPTNYYGVAFGIARYRELLGWEPVKYSRILLDRLLDHIRTFSGEYGYMDETKGEGRFDRYSILIPAEITSQILATGMEEPELIRQMLYRSAHIFLLLANTQGTGFSYGRSIGAYGDSAALEVLSAAAHLRGILTKEEEKLAYGYSLRVVKNMVSFWYDKEMNSINMWEKGRKTDDYRNKNRILGENLSLFMQVVNSLEHWAAAGYHDFREPEGWEEILEKQAKHSLILFARNEYDRGLVIVRDGSQVWSLPLINGGDRYYDKDPYLPVPRQNFVSEGVPESRAGAMVPRVILENGDVLMPVSYIRSIGMREEDDGCKVTYRVEPLCRMGKSGPEGAEGTSASTEYHFCEGKIERKDRIVLGDRYRAREVDLEIRTFSEDPERCETPAERRIRFGTGTIAALEADGYQKCELFAVEEKADRDKEVCLTPHGRMNHRMVWKQTEIPENGVIEVAWRMEIRKD